MRFTAKSMAILACALAPAAVMGQYAMDIRMEYGAYLRFESMPVRISVRNDTDRILLIGGLRETAMIDFRVELNGSLIKRTGRGPLVENLLILPGETKEATVDLRNHYDLQTAGEYRINAVIEVGGKRYLSQPKSVDVVPGIEILSIERPLPNHPSRMRTYSLRYWNRREETYLFMCVTDRQMGISCGVFSLGPLVRVMQPEISVDTDGNVTVRHQSANGVYNHTLFRSTRDGVVLVRQDTSRVTAPATSVPERKVRD